MILRCTVLNCCTVCIYRNVVFLHFCKVIHQPNQLNQISCFFVVACFKLFLRTMTVHLKRFHKNLFHVIFSFGGAKNFRKK